MPIIRVAVLAIVGALIFSVLHMPIPWLLGPLFSVLVAQFFIKKELSWPAQFRSAGLLVIGIAVGQAFELYLFSQLGQLTIYMLVLNVALLLFCLALAWLAARVARISLKTAVLASVPGGLSQLVTFAEEERDTDLAVVTYFHVVRVVAVVLFIPFLISGQLVSGEDAAYTGSWWQLMLMIGLAVLAVPLGKRLKLPVPQFLSPIILVILLKLCAVEVPAMPVSVLHIAQLFIGAYIGLLLKPQMIKLPPRVLVMGLFSTVLMIGCAFLGSSWLSYALQFSFATSFLSTAPGGLDQMALLAAAVGADVSVVTVFQLFRILFIFLLVFPLLKWYYAREKIGKKL